MHLVDSSPRFRLVLTGLLVACGALAACGKAPSDPPTDAPQPEAEVAPSTCGNLGELSASISGAINAEISWEDADMRCESMPRPGGEGIRLRFSGVVGGEWLAMIIAMPELTEGATGTEFDSNVTVSVDGSGRFFSTPNLDTCWTEITRHESQQEATGGQSVSGELSCVGPLGELNGDAFVDIRELRFTGVADWGNK